MSSDARPRGPAPSNVDLAYQQAIVTAAELPRVSREFERLTWQVRMFLGALEIDVLENVERIVSEVQALHEAIVGGDLPAAGRLWREKFERWISDLVGRLDEDFDRDLWVALTREPRRSGAHARRVTAGRRPSAAARPA